MLKNPEMMENLEEAAEAIWTSVDGSADPAKIAEAIKRFDDLMLQVDTLLNGDLT